jgi:hypothetical protein
MSSLPDDPKFTLKLSTWQIQVLSNEIQCQIDSLILSERKLSYPQVLIVNQLKKVHRYLSRRWLLMAYHGKKAGSVSLDLSSLYMLHWVIVYDHNDDDLLQVISLIDQVIKNYPHAYKLILR